MVPFYCVVQKVCTSCDEKPFVKTYEHFLPHLEIAHCDISVETVSCCGYRQYVFEKNNDNIVEELVPPNSVWVAHNGGRFDIFLMCELLVERKIVPKVIMNGSKIMCMELEDRNLKVVDSYLFLSMHLSKFPEALGIKDITKGFHPYLFTDLTYVGPMIGLEYIEPPPEGSKMHAKFDEWYTSQINKTYVFRDEIHYYCQLDVDILRQGCIIFAHLMRNVTGVLPFYDKTCHTVAGLALKIYRTNFLIQETIGQIPASGYGGNVNQSAIALRWLQEIEKDLYENGLELISKFSIEDEQRVMGHFVDGFCPETNAVYQFHGCFYHGCNKCYDGDAYNNICHEKFYNLRERTRRITYLFKTGGYRVTEKWECDYRCESNISQYRLKQLGLRDFLHTLT